VASRSRACARGSTAEATDPDTGLVASLTLTLGDGEDRTLAEPLRLPAFGRIAGTVARRRNTGAGVTVSVSSDPARSRAGPTVTSTWRAQLLGTYTLLAAAAERRSRPELGDAHHPGGDGQRDIDLNGIGLVRVTLRDGAGRPRGRGRRP
jgi:hypothetical protein